MNTFAIFFCAATAFICFLLLPDGVTWEEIRIPFIMGVNSMAAMAIIVRNLTS